LFKVTFAVSMIISKASKKDLEQLYAITKSCAKELIKKGIFQWSELYPSKEILQNDIDLGQLWKLEVQKNNIGIIVLTEIEDKEYQPVKWLTNNSKNLYIHRLAISPSFQGKGYANKLMGFAENYAYEKNYNSIRLDTFSENIQNQKFYEKRNYRRLESIYFENQSELPFYCYEKVLNV